MSNGKYSPTGGDFPSTTTSHEEPTTSSSLNNNNNKSATAAAPIDLFADDGQSTSIMQPPPPNDVYIGDLVTSNTASSMQPGVRTFGTNVIVMPSESRTRNNTTFTFQQPQYDIHPHPHLNNNNNNNSRSTLNVPGGDAMNNNSNNQVQQFDANGNVIIDGQPGVSQLPEHIQQEWDNVTEVTILSSRLRILFFFELLVVIVNGIGLPWAFLATPFVIVGYLGVRWFKYYFSIAGMITFLILIPIAIVTATQVEEEGFARFVLVVLCIVAIAWHAYVGYLNFKFIQVLKKLSPENLEQVQHEMPPVCGCL